MAVGGALLFEKGSGLSFDAVRERLQERLHLPRALKGSAAVRAGSFIAGATGWVPPAVSSVVARAMGACARTNLVISNLPGPSSSSTSTAPACCGRRPPSR